MFRNKKNSEKSERKKAAGAQARQAADEKLQELKVKAEQSPESQAVLRFMNRYSILFHVLLSCGVCFVIEWVSRHSFLEACSFVVDRNLVFLYNSLIVFASLLLVYTVRRRALLRTVISVFWLFLGIINGCILAKRVSPFSFTDLKMVGDLFTMQSNYFTAGEAILVIVGVSLVLLFLVVLWFKGPKFQGKTHRVFGLVMTAAVVMMIPTVTDAAVSNNILTNYFENLAQGYKDYGFVYSFSSSVLDRGMSTPSDYSEEAVDAVLAKIGVEDTDTKLAQASAETEENKASSDQGQTEERKTGTEASKTDASGLLIKGEMQAAFVPEESVKTAAAREDGQADGQTEASVGDTGKTQTGVTAGHPNIICILLESFIDPELVNFLELSDEVVPNFHKLYQNYTSGYLEVPVVGAGTANTEFEILTGMGMQFFGLGEYPYKTILKQTNCESIASDLSEIGYGTHVVHNNGGNFYSRRNAFSMMGFDTFTSKEMMDIREYTPLGTWPKDEILIGEVEKALDYTPDQPDFVYTITVGSHGDYPQEKVLDDPEIQVSGVEDEGMHYAWEYYVNMVHETDKFIGDLIEMLSERDEPTIVVMFGDHLPTMGLEESDMKTGTLFKTQYATWNNFGLAKSDKSMTAYQLMADTLDSLDIHNGTMFRFQQNRYKYATEDEYQNAMELLQYDILYGDHYVYGGGNPYPASNLIMGTQDVVISQIMETDRYYYIIGENFTNWSRVFVNDTKVSTKYLSSRLLRIKKEDIPSGDNEVVVNQMGSSDTLFRSSNQMMLTKAEETESESIAAE
ncbi:MAG: LTA synthase family protein [Lachnospiraceae bacterium]